MNREIKFRAWDSDRKIMGNSIDIQTVYGSLAMYNSIQRQNDEEADYIILMQYTGLKDKNGVEIYEGDIVRFGYYDIEIPEISRSIGVVEYDDKHLCYKLGKKINVPFYEGLRDIEVIGNIYQNPELLN